MAKKAKKAAKKAPRSVKKAVRKALRRARPVPDGYHTVTAHLVQEDCIRAIEFYKGAFGAKERMRMPGPGGKTVHAEIRIGDSIVMMSDEMTPMPGQPGVYKSPKAAGLATGAVFLYVRDVDAAFARALSAGCTVRTPVMDMFWGDRFAQVIDPFGHTWAMATHTEDLSPKEIARRQQAEFAKMQQGGGQA